MPAPKSIVRYRISLPIHAVKLAERPGSTLPDPTETLIKIPAGEVIQLDGRSSASGLMTVLWNGDRYSVFFADLQEKAEPLT